MYLAQEDKMATREKQGLGSLTQPDRSKVHKVSGTGCLTVRSLLLSWGR